MHVILDTRPSRFSACNIEKLGVALERGYNICSIIIQLCCSITIIEAPLINIINTYILSCIATIMHARPQCHAQCWYSIHVLCIGVNDVHDVI